MVKENSSLVTHLNNKCHYPNMRRNVCIFSLYLSANYAAFCWPLQKTSSAPSNRLPLCLTLRAISERDWYGVPSSQLVVCYFRAKTTVPRNPRGPQRSISVSDLFGGFSKTGELSP